MLVAAHNNDLKAARAAGLATAFVARPTEYGPGQTKDLAPTGDWDVVAADFIDLADFEACVASASAHPTPHPPPHRPNSTCNSGTS